MYGVNQFKKDRDDSLNELERHIDGGLHAAAVNGAVIMGRIKIFLEPGTSASDISLLIPKYKSSGWDDVQYNSGGTKPYLEFISSKLV